MAGRTVEDLLRHEYFELLPEIRRTAEYLETTVRCHLLPNSQTLKRFERIEVRSRVKDCESSIAKLRGKHGGTFEPASPEQYTLTTLNDLAAVRVLAFPESRVSDVDRTLQGIFPSWIADPVIDGGEHLAFKYRGFSPASERVRGEYQVVSMLIGLFWEVEHDAIYKAAPTPVGVFRKESMKDVRTRVYHALSAFEREFAQSVQENEESLG